MQLANLDFYIGISFVYTSLNLSKTNSQNEKDPSSKCYSSELGSFWGLKNSGVFSI